jgi:[ribosomal protein S5]-alanine N-acetyltransferase
VFILKTFGNKHQFSLNITASFLNLKEAVIISPMMNVSLSKSILQPWRIEDAPSLALHANNPRIAKNLRDGFPHPYKVDDARYWITHIANTPNALILAIVIDKEAVGSVGIHFQNDVYRKNAELGYWLSEKYWKQGIMTEAVQFMVQHSFQNFDIHRIYSGVFETNIGSMRVLEKCGFTREAIHRKAVIKNDIIMDEYLYSRCIL